jgi:hypothetical protein
VLPARPKGSLAEADPRIATMVAFGAQVYADSSAINGGQVDVRREHGFGDREIAHVVGCVVGVVALNVLTGAFNLVAGNRTSEPGLGRRSRTQHTAPDDCHFFAEP